MADAIMEETCSILFTEDTWVLVETLGCFFCIFGVVQRHILPQRTKKTLYSWLKKVFNFMCNNVRV